MLSPTALRVLSRTRRRVLGLLGGSAVVLIYHRVATLERDPQGLSVPPAVFREQIATITERYPVVPLGHLVRLLARGQRMPRRCVYITFDDGYADNLIHAKPVLEAAGASATFFVTTDRLSDPAEQWWDELDRLLLSPCSLPEKLILPIGDALDCSSCRDWDASPARASAGWTVRDSTRTPRQALYAELCDRVSQQTPAERSRTLECLREQIGATDGPRAENRHLTAGEIGELDTGVTSVGVHTASHPRLATLSASQQLGQIADSKRLLEEICGRTMDLFSYPYGDPDSYTPETVQMVRRLGFAGAVATHHGITHRLTDPYLIPRYPAAGLSAPELADSLATWFGA